MKKNKKSNYSLILLCVLLFDFINYYLRVNSIIGEPLGMNLKRITYVFLILNFIYAFVIYLVKNADVSKIAFVNLVLFVFILIRYFIGTGPIELGDIMNLSSWFIIPFLFYYYGLPKSERLLKMLVTVFVVMFIFMYYRFGILSGIRNAGVTNAIYFLIMSVPFVMFMDNKIIKAVLYIAITALTILSMKIVPLIMLFVALLIAFVFKKNNLKISLGRKCFVFCVAFVIVGMLFIMIANLVGIDVFGNISEDIDNEGNGRFAIWRNIFAVFKNASLGEQLFGLGFEKSEELFGIAAHSDYIEVLFSFGYVGLVLLVISISLISKKLIYRAIKSNSKYLNVALATVCQVIIIFAFSNSFFVSNYSLISLAMVGFLLNYYDNVSSKGKLYQYKNN